MKYLIVILCAVGSLSSFADDAETIANGAPSKALSAAKAKRPALRDILTCAERVSRRFFGDDYLLKWAANTDMNNERSSVAVSAFYEGAQPYFLTVTPDKIIKTPAYRTSHTLGGLRTDGVEVQATLDLTGRFNLERGLPVVDPSDQISNAWFLSFTRWEKGPNNVHPDRTFSSSDLHEPHSEIKASDSLTGEAADQAVDQMIETLRTRVTSASDKVAEITRLRESNSSPKMRASISGPGYTVPRTARDRVFNERELAEMRNGLCSCEAIFPEVDEVRKKMSDREYPALVWPDKADEARKFTYGDLTCGES
jgi:hypothetical protein